MNDDRDPRACFAQGCPCAGSISTSTSGTDEWACWQHVKAPRSEWQRITAEMNRLGFLVDACKRLRSAGSMPFDQAQLVTKTVSAQLRQAQRSDLCYQTSDKHRYGWLSRLEGVLTDAARTEQQQAELINQAA